MHLRFWHFSFWIIMAQDINLYELSTSKNRENWENVKEWTLKIGTKKKNL